jgi:hypothetical protein
VSKFFSWITRVPLLVWLFLIATQALNLALAPGRLAQDERSMQFLDNMESRRIPDEGWRQALAEQRRHYEGMQRDDWFRLIGSAILLPAFVCGAFWRWRASRAKPAESSHQTPTERSALA